MAKLKLSAPWIIFYHELEAMFKKDRGVRVIFDEDENVVSLYVESTDRADALAQILPEEKDFGAVKLKIRIVPANPEDIEPNPENLWNRAFFGSPVLSYIQKIRGIFSNDITYVVFVNEVVQYYNDSLSDVNGLCSTLYQEIAKDIFLPQEGVFFCTDVPDTQPIVKNSCGKPLGEWP